MNIVHIISSLQRGGAEMALANLLRHVRTQAEHTVLFFHDGPVRKDIEALGIICLRISAPAGYYNPYFLYKLLQKIKKLDPDCLHTDLWAANLLGRICAWFLRIPCISVIHAMTEHEGKLRATIDRIIPCTPTSYVAVSHDVANSMQRHRRLHRAPCVVIENGIDAQELQTALGDSAVIAKLKTVGQSSFIIGTVGRLIPAKNHALLLTSFAQLRAQAVTAHLVIIGSGSEKENLDKLAQKLALTEHITWIVGHLSHPYYHYFDCYVQPSRSEGLSIALLEALACSRPVIVTGHNKRHPVIQDQENGLVIEADNLQELTHAVKYLFENQARRQEIARRGHETVLQKFCLTKTAQAYLTLLKNTLFAMFNKNSDRIIKIIGNNYFRRVRS